MQCKIPIIIQLLFSIFKKIHQLLVPNRTKSISQHVYTKLPEESYIIDIKNTDSKRNYHQNYYIKDYQKDSIVKNETHNLYMVHKIPFKYDNKTYFLKIKHERHLIK